MESVDEMTFVGLHRDLIYLLILLLELIYIGSD